MFLSVIFIITVILTKELVMATEECSEYQFRSPFYPGESCEDIYNMNPESHDKSGYYWILDGPRKVYCGMSYTGSSCEDIYNNNPETGDKSGYYRININQWTFCNMTEITVATLPTCAGVGGGWRRIANMDISTGGDCPSGWRKDTHSGVSFCRVVSDDYNTCSSTTFSTNGTSYQRVCGRARGYQKGWSVAFTLSRSQTIDGYYVDGLSITHGNPRQHIWTFANGLYDGPGDDLNNYDQFNCPCAPGSLYSSPPFVGTNYYCESGTNNTYSHSTYYFNDPLWDGSGCITSNCCDNPTQPWFYRELNGTTTDDIEARICREHGFISGSTLIDQLELYIQ